MDGEGSSFFYYDDKRNKWKNKRGVGEEEGGRELEGERRRDRWKANV